MNPLVLPTPLLNQARMFFEACGSRQEEGTALIKQTVSGPQLVIPDQTPTLGAFGGVSVRVSAQGQMQLARALRAGELYVARIHSHPAEAFHSKTDDKNPVLTHDGALSIVVPNFGSGLKHGLGACAIFRRMGNRWIELPPGIERDRWICDELASRKD